MKRGNFLMGSAMLCAAAFLGTSAASAQTHYNSNVSLGVKGGIDLSRVSFTPSIRQSMKLGMYAGLTFRYIEENHFGLIVEANIEQRGWKENFEELEFKYDRTINYVQIPFLAHIYFGRRGKFFVNLGPEIGFNIGESTSSDFDYRNVASVAGFPLNRRTTYQYLMDADQVFDYGISGGIGGEFNINRKNSIYLEARFYYGLGNVLKSGRRENFRGSNSMSIMAGVGYWFRIK